MGFVDKAKQTIAQVVAKAQHAMARGQTKMSEVQAKRTLDRLYRDLGAAYHAE